VSATNPTNAVVRRSSYPRSTAGGLAASAWLAGIATSAPPTRWSAEIALDIAELAADRPFDNRSDPLFHLRIYSEEWGFYFCHRGRSSWIRVTDAAFAHGRDDFDLLHATPLLGSIGVLVHALEVAYGLEFRRDIAAIRTDLPPAFAPAIRRWVASL
jgi:hypothetical protein